MSLERYKADDVVRLNSPGVNTLEYYLEWLIDEAILRTDSGRHPYVDSIAPVIDAALEYWIMYHKSRKRHSYTDVDRMLEALNMRGPLPWCPKKGWLCDCIN